MSESKDDRTEHLDQELKHVNKMDYQLVFGEMKILEIESAGDERIRLIKEVYGKEEQ